METFKVKIGEQSSTSTYTLVPKKTVQAPIIVDPVTVEMYKGEPGPIGPIGPKGADGTSTLNYATIEEVKEGLIEDKVISPSILQQVLKREYVQANPSNEWTIKHDMGRNPAVAIVDSAGTEVVGDVQYIDSNNLVLRFIGAFSGKAYLS